MKQKITEIRSNLCLWAIGKLPATLPQVEAWIIELDNLLQMYEL